MCVPNFAMEGTGMYTAIVLTQESADRLKEVVENNLKLEGFEFQTPAGESLPHHVTLNLGSFNASLNDPELLGKTARILVDKIWYNEDIGACAAEALKLQSDLQKINCANKIPHITICLKPPAKPVSSNQLFENPLSCYILQLNRTLVLDGIIQEVN